MPSKARREALDARKKDMWAQHQQHPTSRDQVTAEERRLIDEAIETGRVRKIPMRHTMGDK